MKSLKLVLLPVLALAVGALAPLSLSAQDRPARPERAGPGGPGGSGGPGGPAARGGDRLAAMTEQLGLTADQKTKVQAILEEERASLEALRSETNLSQEERRTKMQEIRQSFAGKIRAALTPEQQSKWAGMRAARGPGAAGAPGAAGPGKAQKKDGNK